MFQSQKYSHAGVQFLRLLSLVVFSVTSSSLFAFKPPQLSDYQLKYLASEGVVKLIYKYENKSEPKRNDTLSIRQYDKSGFLTALDSFNIGKDNFRHLFLSQRLRYSKDGKVTMVSVEESKRYERAVFENITVKHFDEFQRLVLEKITIDRITSLVEYKYDKKGNCIEKLEKWGNVADTTLYNYEYDSNNNIKEEECLSNSKRYYFYIYEYNLSGQLIKLIQDNRTEEKYEYDLTGKKIRCEYSCHSESVVFADGLREIDYYSYNQQGQMIQTKRQSQQCNPQNSLRYESIDKLYYMPSGLIESRCSSGGCERFIYLKKS